MSQFFAKVQRSVKQVSQCIFSKEQAPSASIEMPTVRCQRTEDQMTGNSPEKDARPTSADTNH